MQDGFGVSQSTYVAVDRRILRRVNINAVVIALGRDGNGGLVVGGFGGRGELRVLAAERGPSRAVVATHLEIYGVVVVVCLCRVPQVSIDMGRRAGERRW